jgi:hypothetical protein
MAWIAVNLDDTLLTDMGDGQEIATPGAVETLTQLVQEGHRITVVTSRFAPMPASERNRMKEQLEQTLVGQGFPPLEVWAGSTKPAADIYVGADAVTFDNDWNMALAQIQVMLEEQGLVPGPQPDDGSMEGIDPQAAPEGDPNAAP